MKPIDRNRLLEMLDNYANGVYQAIMPEVVAEAARHLRNSQPMPEDPVASDASDPSIAAAA